MALSTKGRKILALSLLIGPTALFIVSMILNIIVNISLASLDAYGAIATVFNIFTFLIGVLVLITWLPGIVVGIILLATNPNSPPTKK